MKFVLSLLSLALLTAPAFAQSAPVPVCTPVDDVKALLTKNGEKFVEVSVASLLGVNSSPTTGLLISTLGGVVVVGVEHNDCIDSLHPIGPITAAIGS